MSDTSAATRGRSSAIFGNEKFVEVVLDLHQHGSDTAQGIAGRTHLSHSLVRSVLLRLAESGLLTPLPRANRRGALYYEAVVDDPEWLALVGLCRLLSREKVAEDSAG